MEDQIQRKKKKIEQLRKQRLIRQKEKEKLMTADTHSATTDQDSHTDISPRPPVEKQKSHSVDKFQRFAGYKPFQETINFKPIRYEKQIQSDPIEIKVQDKEEEPSAPKQRGKPKPAQPQKEQKSQQPKKTQELSDLQIQATIDSKNFKNFFQKSSKLLMKVIQNPVPIALQDALENDQIPNQSTKERLTSLYRYFDSNLTENRVVTSMDWSSHLDKGNVILSSYSRKFDGSIKDQVGVLLVWSLNLKSRPQMSFFSQSQVTTSCFYPFSINQIIGGCENGQLQLWDMRTSSLPVMRTGMTSNGHKYPVYSLKVLGTSQSSMIVSGSNDGKICSWDIKYFSNPVSYLKLQNNKEEMNLTTLDFIKGDTNNFYFGCQNGAVGKWTLLSGEDRHLLKESHKIHVTGMSINQWTGQHSGSLQGLLLSSSMDWTVKLWQPKFSKPIWTFDYSQDYVYDVQWHPRNPTLFGSVNNEGYLDLYNLVDDFDTPGVHFKASDRAINKMRWNQEGSRCLVGDSEGNVMLLGLEEGWWQFDEQRFHYFQQMFQTVSQGKN